MGATRLGIFVFFKKKKEVDNQDVQALHSVRGKQVQKKRNRRVAMLKLDYKGKKQKRFRATNKS